jgi:hypothetical protein
MELTGSRTNTVHDGDLEYLYKLLKDVVEGRSVDDTDLWLRKLWRWLVWFCLALAILAWPSEVIGYPVWSGLAFQRIGGCVAGAIRRILLARRGEGGTWTADEGDPEADLAAYCYVGSLRGTPMVGGICMDSSPQGPYYMSFWGRHLVQNSAAYLRWAMEAVLPNVPRAGAVLFGLGVFGTALFLRLRCAGRLPSLQVATELLKEPVVLTVWFVLALLPVLPLPNHTYRYYAGLALPALIIAWWQAMFLIFRRLLGDGLRSNVALGAMLVTVLVASGAALRERVASQIDWDGSNLPLKRAGVVAWVQPLVSSSAAQLSGDMTLLFDGLEVWSFGKEQGPRLWSNNPTLQVFSTAHLKAGDGGTLAIVNAPTNHAEVYTGARNRIELDPTRTFVVHKQNGGVRMDLIRVFLERQAKRASGAFGTSHR